MDDIKKIFERQRANRWNIARTSARERIAKLKKIREAVWANRGEIHRVIYEDYKKNPAETDITEIYPTISEINHTIKHLSRWMKPHRVKTPLVLFGTKSEVRYEPKGLILLLSPWNYPFNLFMVPLVTAVSAGNCVMAKASTKVPHTAAFLKKFIAGLFEENEAMVVEGDHAIADALLELPFDHIFFTGSTPIGKKIMKYAAEHLAPVTLELGGKSPVIVDQSAHIRRSAERVMWGKFINAGQTCVAPDYLLIHESREKEFIEEARAVLARRYGETEAHREASPEYCRLVSEGHLKGLKKILDDSVQAGATIACGGKFNPAERFLSPTLLTKVKNDSPVMKEEIFGPILPILTFRSLDEAFAIIRSREKPLALYVFSRDRGVIEEILKNTTAGGTCVNSTVIHLGNNHLPFGGVGASGMGNYHGFYGFRNLSHERAVLRQGPIDMLKNFYPPYTKKVKRLIEVATKYLV
ncbi:MAG: aldehyde dehydrogenase family protein [Deltaproteobacteria bacterium]|nr:aldehyde dehydrogenase family protein [Deltaproteobacteria bacterium]